MKNISLPGNILKKSIIVEPHRYFSRERKIRQFKSKIDRCFSFTYEEGGC